MRNPHGKILDTRVTCSKNLDVPYGQHFDPEMGIVSLENAYIWDEYVESSIG